MSIAIPFFQQGARVRVRRGDVPIDAALLGRSGTVVLASEYEIRRYGVALDGDRQIRFFAPTELEVLELPGIAPEREQARTRLSRP